MNRPLLDDLKMIQQGAARLEAALHAPLPLHQPPVWNGRAFDRLYGVVVVENRLDGDGDPQGARARELHRRLSLLKQWRVFNAWAGWFNLAEVRAGLPAQMIQQYGLALIADSANAVPLNLLTEWAGRMEQQGASGIMIDDASAKEPAAVERMVAAIRAGCGLPILGSVAVNVDRSRYAACDALVPQFYRKDARATQPERLDDAAAAVVKTWLERFPWENIHLEAFREYATWQNRPQWLTTLADEFAAMYTVCQQQNARGYLIYGWDDVTEWTALAALRQAILGCGLDYWSRPA